MIPQEGVGQLAKPAVGRIQVVALVPQQMEMSHDSRERKTLLTYYDPFTGEFSSKIGDVDAFLDYCLSGVPKHNKQTFEEKIPEIDYKF